MLYHMIIRKILLGQINAVLNLVFCYLDYPLSQIIEEYSNDEGS